MISNKKYIITIVLLVVLAVGTFFGGLKMGQKGYVYSGSNFSIINQNDAPKDVDYSLLWNVLNTLDQDYIDKPIDQQKVLYGAVSGAVAALGDPYTEFFDPQSYKDFETQLAGNFDGIGAEVGMQDGNVVIIAPLAGNPAQKAGLLAGDIILKINGTDITGMTLDDVVDAIRGPKGTTVTLTIYRPSTNVQKDYTITRAEIVQKSVTWSYKTVDGKKYAVVDLTEFGDDTDGLFQQAAADIVKNKVSGIVLDLRGDPGGYLDDAVQVVSYWADAGKLVVAEKHSDGTTENYTAKGGNILKGIPTVVLIDGGTASAAEITTGALHDYGMASTVGVKSFGKGSVQELINMPQNTALKVTVAKWYTPNGININHNGLNPDFVVNITSDQITKGQDPQMDKALQLLTSGQAK